MTVGDVDEDGDVDVVVGNKLGTFLLYNEGRRPGQPLVSGNLAGPPGFAEGVRDSEPRTPTEELATFVQALDAHIKEGKAARMAARPPVAHYRLSRKEYQNTVYDLLGVRYDPAKPGELNEDTLWHGFERIGSELSLSPSHRWVITCRAWTYANDRCSTVCVRGA